MRKLNCLRCNAEMRLIGQKKFQLGQTGWVLGDLPNLVAGAIEFMIYCCPDCGKIEFFRPESWEKPEESAGEFDFDGVSVDQGVESVDRHGTPQIRCPACGQHHDFDYPKCPYCKYDYYRK